ncbi:MAG: ribosome-associated translation inhibitor RaiA [Oscillospiraceae bacterium]|jgi:putative sigma-54 modulation protein|nr:ribosome-associated translation inhibitor RaiA [Oscillospiraceae bacterium]
MNLTFSARKTELDARFKERAQKKLNKFDRFFDSASAFATVTRERDRFTVEITISSGGMFYRSENTAFDEYNALEGATNAIFRQISKNKTKLAKKLRKDAFVPQPDDLSSEIETVGDEEEYKIVKSKTFSVKPMTIDEAILQMNMLEHEFFIFKNSGTNETSVVYKRKDGDYGLLEPEVL